MNHRYTTRTRTQYSVLNIATGIGGYILNTILGFVCRMVFVRCLAIDYLGVNGLFANVLTVLSLAELGIGGAIVYALYQPLADQNEEKIAALMGLFAKAYRIIGLAVAAIGLALMPFLHVIIRQQPDIQESIYLLYLITLLNTAGSYFFSYRASLLTAAQRNYIVNGISYATTIVQSLLQIGALLLFRNYLVYLLIQTAGTFLYNVLVSHMAKRQFPYIRQKTTAILEAGEKQKLYANIRDLFIYKVSGLLVNSTDNILITFFKGLATTGIASNYVLLVNTLTALIGQGFNGLTASVGNHNASAQPKEKYAMFRFLQMMNYWVFGACAIGVLYCSSDIVSLAFGPEMILPFNIPFVLALNFFSVGIMNAVWMYKHTMGIFRRGRFVQFFTGILNIVFSVLLGSRFGVFGILIATFFARLCTSLWYDPYAVFRYGFEKPLREYLSQVLKYAGILIPAVILCQLAVAVLPAGRLWSLFVKMILCLAIPSGLFVVCLWRTKEFDRLKLFLRNLR